MRSSLVKVILAFAAGLVVALASALIYVRVHDERRATPVIQVEQAPEPDTQAKAAVPETAPADTEPAEQKPESKVAPDEVSPPARHVRKAPVSKPKAMRPAEIARPVQVVQNTAQNMPPTAFPPTAAPSYPPVNQPASGAQVQGPPQPNEIAPGPAQAPQPHVVELAAGSSVAIRLAEPISTDHNYTGDTFRGTLDQPIIRDGFIIADKGSKVLGRIAEADKAGRVRGVAALSLTLTEINTTDGQRIGVQTNLVEKRAQGSTGTDAAKIAGGAALGALIGALGGGGKGAAIGAGAGGAAGTGVVLATRGKAAVLPNEARLTFQLASPVTITEHLNH